MAATVTIVAGEASAQFPIHAVDDALRDGTRTVTISVAAAGYLAGSAVLQVTDHESLAVSIAPRAWPKTPAPARQRER